MGIARSSYYARSEAAARDAGILARIHAICDTFEAYGYRRVTAELRHRGPIVNGKTVRRLMRQHGLQPVRRRRHVVTTDSDHQDPIFPNLAAGLVVSGPDQLWVADITFVATAKGFVYVAIILDAPPPPPGGVRFADRIDGLLTIDGRVVSWDTRSAARSTPVWLVPH